MNKTMVTLSWKGESLHLAHQGLLCQWTKGATVMGSRGNGVLLLSEGGMTG